MDRKGHFGASPDLLAGVIKSIAGDRKRALSRNLPLNEETCSSSVALEFHNLYGARRAVEGEVLDVLVQF
jgi:hypothetical protein